jgi:hypothetical protein
LKNIYKIKNLPNGKNGKNPKGKVLFDNAVIKKKQNYFSKAYHFSLGFVLQPELMKIMNT